MQISAVLPIARRSSWNPLLKPRDLRPSSPLMTIDCLLNPGVFEFDNKTWLLIRVAERPYQTEGSVTLPIYDESGGVKIISFDVSDPDLDRKDPRVIKYKGKDYLTTLSHLRLLCSHDGKYFYQPEGYNSIFGTDKHEAYGIEDCRVTKIDDVFHLTYTMVSSFGVGVGLIRTRDWKTFERCGMILPPHNKDCAIFSEKINGSYYALHRPSSPELGGNFIWIGQTDNVLYWGNHRCVATTRESMWDSARVGAGAAPIKTSRGWLEIYHGADSSNRYCLGALLLDLNDPSVVLGRSEQPLLEPTAEYEKKGFFGNVVFTNGHIVDGDKLQLYYGASDEFICSAELSIADILETL